MSDDLPGPPGSGDRDDRPGDRPTEPLTPPGPPPPASGPPPSPTWPQPPPAQEYGQAGATTPYGGQPGYGGQPPGYGPPYGAPPGYGYPAGPQADGTATAALVIAVVGFFICPPVGAIVALVMANSAQRRIEASGGRLSGLELAKAARIIAIVELALTALLILGGVLVVALSLGPQ